MHLKKPCTRTHCAWDVFFNNVTAVPLYIYSKLVCLYHTVNQILYVIMKGDVGNRIAFHDSVGNSTLHCKKS
jgi:hypothetical protein